MGYQGLLGGHCRLGRGVNQALLELRLDPRRLRSGDCASRDREGWAARQGSIRSVGRMGWMSAECSKGRLLPGGIRVGPGRLVGRGWWRRASPVGQSSDDTSERPIADRSLALAPLGVG